MTRSQSFHTSSPGTGEPVIARAPGTFRFAERRSPSGKPTPQSAAVAAAPGRITRPRGRLLIAVLIAISCSAGAAALWDSLIRYRAYGVVTGQVVSVSAPNDGLLESVQITEGQLVDETMPLGNLSSIEFDQQLQRVRDQLSVVQARLQAELVKVRWQTRVDETEMTRSIAEFHETTSRLWDSTGQLRVLEDQLKRTEDLFQRSSATAADLAVRQIEEDACREKVKAIEEALTVLKSRADKAGTASPPGQEQLEPLLAECRMLTNEADRLRHQIARGRLSAPVKGRVLQRFRHPGEIVQEHEPLFTVLEDASLEIELFLPQKMTAEYEVGDILEIKVEPNEELIPCRIVRVGSEHREPPRQLQIFYRDDERLLPVVLKPQISSQDQPILPLGAVAKLPWFPVRS